MGPTFTHLTFILLLLFLLLAEVHLDLASLVGLSCDSLNDSLCLVVADVDEGIVLLVGHRYNVFRAEP